MPQKLSPLLKKTSSLKQAHNPEALIPTMWCFLTMHMGMRGRDEDWKLRYAVKMESGDLKEEPKQGPVKL